VVQSEVDLSEGYCSINEIILERNRIMIKNMRDALIKSNIPVLAIKTDCVFVDQKHHAAGQIALEKSGFKFATDKMTKYESIGCLRIEIKNTDLLPKKQLQTFQVDVDQMLPLVCEIEKPEYIHLESETYEGWDDK